MPRPTRPTCGAVIGVEWGSRVAGHFGLVCRRWPGHSGRHRAKWGDERNDVTGEPMPVWIEWDGDERTRCIDCGKALGAQEGHLVFTRDGKDAERPCADGRYVWHFRCERCHEAEQAKVERLRW